MAPRVLVLPDHEQMSLQAADWFASRVRRMPRLLACLPAGATPLRFYEALLDLRNAGRFPTRRLRVVKLDEWAGLPRDHPATCESYLVSHCLALWDIPPERFIGFDPMAADPEAECRRIQRELSAVGPIDVCVLGLGRNGHVGLNEPGDAAIPGCHLADLSPETLGHSMLDGCDPKPTRGFTLGIRDVLLSWEVVLLASGRQKAEALRRFLHDDASPRFPATLLRVHPRLTCFCDRDAARLL